MSVSMFRARLNVAATSHALESDLSNLLKLLRDSVMPISHLA